MAFWLLDQPSLAHPKITHITRSEIDVVEHYGVLPYVDLGTLHRWPTYGPHWMKQGVVASAGMDSGFHNYGLMVTPHWTTFYFDGRAFNRQPTPPSARVRKYVLVSLAMGALTPKGWPDNQPAPKRKRFHMYVKYVRVYAKRQSDAKHSDSKHQGTKPSG